MKKFLVLALLIFGISSIYAQDKTAKEYKIEAADFYKAKDYANGLASFEKSIELYEAEGKTDTSLYYNAGACAYKVKSYDKALAFFDKSIELSYKTCTAYLYKANTLKKQKNYEEMEATCNIGIKNCDKNKSKFEDILFNYYLKAGLKTFNNAAKIQSDITPLATSDPEKYKTEMEKVKKEFSKSLPMLEKAQAIDPDDANCNNAIKQANDIINEVN
jgi:tetratricopeptide (TPR) repeat protein